jgi:hypothetical protein
MDWKAKRPDGTEAPYIPVWKFKMRFPGVHYRWEWPDYIQGLLMGAVCLSIMQVLMDTLGMPFEVALAIVIINGFLYLWHAWLGDPVVPGWVTPAIPLLLAYVNTFPMGPERMHALIAFEMELGIWCIFLGITGLGEKFINAVPPSIKAGVIIGAGISAILKVFDPKNGKMLAMPYTVCICLLVALYMMYSPSFKRMAEHNPFLKTLANLGILPSIVLAIIIGSLIGEAKIVMEWGISKPDFITLWTDWVPWGKLGWPSMELYIKSIPLVIATYIVIFGEAVQAQAIINDAQKYRPDDPVDYNPDRTHMIVGMRNLLMSIFGPDLSMCGPMWAAMTVVVYERWKKGRKDMDTSIGGTGSFRFGTFTMYWIAPLVSLAKSVLPAAFSLTLTIQGFVSVYVGARQARTLTDLGIAGIVAGVLLCRDAAWAFAAGIVACLVIYGRHFFTGDPTAQPIWAEQVMAKNAEVPTPDTGH